MPNNLSPSADIVRFRRELHAHPELSERENRTAERVAERISRARPTEIVGKLGPMRTGLCALFDSGSAGSTVLLRCELDALPIHETNTFAHRSTADGVAHKCGHDGHMAMLVAVADGLHARPIRHGRVCLLFQPAEETGTGAAGIIGDPRFQALGPPDFVYALHNVPRYPLGRVLVRSGLFAQGSVGFIVTFTGTTSHSSYPEHGANPAAAVTGLVTAVNRFDQALAQRAAGPVLGTVTYAQLGRIDSGPNFGTAPGEGTVMGVVRARRNEDLALVRGEIATLAGRLAAEAGLGHRLTWHEAFVATESDPECTALVEEAARQQGLAVESLAEPFRWSEDFGHFTERYRGAFFGLGSGLDQPQLHDDGYDFPDELIPIGSGLLRAILDRHLETER